MSTVLLGWCVVRIAQPLPGGRTSYRLTGIVVGHPILKDVRQILTGEVEWMADDGSWAKTNSMYFSLRVPLPNVMISALERIDAPKISALCGVPLEAVLFETWTGKRSSAAMPPPPSQHRPRNLVPDVDRLLRVRGAANGKTAR